MIAEGEQRTPERYESCLGPLGRFFGFPTSYVGNVLRAQRGWTSICSRSNENRPRSIRGALARAKDKVANRVRDNVMQMTLFLFAGAGLRRCLAAPDFLLDNPPQLAGLGNRSLECFC